MVLAAILKDGIHVGKPVREVLKCHVFEILDVLQGSLLFQKPYILRPVAQLNGYTHAVDLNLSHVSLLRGSASEGLALNLFELLLVLVIEDLDNFVDEALGNECVQQYEHTARSCSSDGHQSPMLKFEVRCAIGIGNRRHKVNQLVSTRLDHAFALLKLSQVETHISNKGNLTQQHPIVIVLWVAQIEDQVLD